MKETIDLFCALGRLLSDFGNDAPSCRALEAACAANEWFAPGDVRRAVGALVDDKFRDMVKERATQSEAKIFIPSGAVCGTDGLRSSAVGELEEVELITTKGPKSLEGVDWIVDHGIDVDSLTEPTTVFSGTARDAVKLFPKNINVAATVSLLGVGFDKTKVTIVVDPSIHSNSHELRVKGEFGQMTCHTFNVPSPDNPKTSYLAAMSAISALKRIVRNEWIGI